MPVESEDEFRKKLTEAFVQEAQEWLDQIHVALDELQQGPVPDRHRALAQEIQAGISNIARSAATIGLKEVEQASSSATAFVGAIQDPTAEIGAADYTALCKRLGRIRASLMCAAGVASGAVPSQSESESVSISTRDVLAALYQFQKKRPDLGSSGRNLLRTIIDHVEELRKTGVERCNVTSVKELLDRCSERETEFAEAAQVQIPAVIDAVRLLKSGEQEPDQSVERLRTSVEHAAQLLSSAQRVNAPQASFFNGLYGFLTIVTQRRVAVTAKKYEAVESRLRESLRDLQAWVEAGRAERSAISGIFRIGCGAKGRDAP